MSATAIQEKAQACSVCGEPAFVECLVYDVYLNPPDVFMERDFTCPFLCKVHFRENEDEAFSHLELDALNVTMQQVAERYKEGIRRMDMAVHHSVPGSGEARTAAEIISLTRWEKVPAMRDFRGSVSYPYTNREDHQGFTIYKRLF